MSGVTADPSYLRDPLGGYVTPHRNRAAGYPKLTSDPVAETRGRTQEVHTKGGHHPDTLSHTARSGKAQNGRKTLRISERGLTYTQRMDIAQRIRKARAAAGYSQRELARQLGVAGSAVAQWETGATSPSIGKRAEIAKLLGIGFMELLPEASSLPPETIRQSIDRTVAKLPPHKQAGFLVTIEAVAELLGNQEPENHSPPEADKKRA